jgi:N-acetyl-gamma-glutamyl-phosphate reductase
MAEPRVAVVGGRGHTGAELLRLLHAHDGLELSWVGSRRHAGDRVDAHVEGAGQLVFETPSPERVAELEVEAIVLALPNEIGKAYVERIAPERVVVDLSADHRFDSNWAYGQPERRRRAIAGARRIANPGCYATAAQLALEPVAERLVSAPRIFGVSGYSGAGVTPSPRNDPEHLRDNLLPYAPIGHVHEREIAAQVGRPVHFMPHVAPFFRGIMLTIDLELDGPLSADELLATYRDRYEREPLVRVQAEAPLVRSNVGRPHVVLGGFAASGTRAVVVATIDNLLKGAATQAVQNLNLALGIDELRGIDVDAS